MVYEVIGKVVLYILGTIFVGLLFDDVSQWTDPWFGAWLAGVLVFTCLIIPMP